MWTCPSCGLDGLEDGVSRCPGCGFSKRSFPNLSGTSGSFTLKTSLVFGRKNLASLAGDDAVFAADKQFELLPEGEAWMIRAFPGTKNATALNGVEVSDSGQPIKDGDVICIASRRDSSIKKAEIKISMNS